MNLTSEPPEAFTGELCTMHDRSEAHRDRHGTPQRPAHPERPRTVRHPCRPNDSTRAAIRALPAGPTCTVVGRRTQPRDGHHRQIGHALVLLLPSVLPGRARLTPGKQCLGLKTSVAITIDRFNAERERIRIRPGGRPDARSRHRSGRSASLARPVHAATDGGERSCCRVGRCGPFLLPRTGYGSRGTARDLIAEARQERARNEERIAALIRVIRQARKAA